MQRQLQVLTLLVLTTLLGVVFVAIREPRPQVFILDGAGYPVPEAGEAGAGLRSQVVRSILVRGIADARTRLGRGFGAEVLSSWSSSCVAAGALEGLPRQVGETRVEVVSAREVSASGQEDEASIWEIHWREIASGGMSKGIVARFRVMFSDQWRSSMNPLGVTVTAMIDHQIDLGSAQGD